MTRSRTTLTTHSHTNPSPQATNKPARQRRDPAAVLAASTFSAGLLLLPPTLQTDARRLYQLLRTIDDLVDENHPQAPARVEALECWAEGRYANTPETRTITRLAARYPLPHEAVSEFCAGMRHDLARESIANDEELELYCHRIAGTVGIMLAALLGTSHPDGQHKMAILGRAMQRTNILRDIDEDHANGRLYIPRTAIEQHGPPIPGKREALLRDQIARADALYQQGQPAIALLIDGGEAMAISTALYREILRQIERDGYGRKAGRATVPAWRKSAIIAQHKAATARARKASAPTYA